MKACDPVKCGALDISYPFWDSYQQKDYCGYPSLEITCNDDKPILAQSYDTHYYIDRVFYENSSFVAMKSILVNWQSNCSVPHTNVTLNFDTMEVSTINKELVFFYNCAKNMRAASVDYIPVTCSSPESVAANSSFVRLFQNYSDDEVPGESLGNCSTSKIPVTGWNGSTVDQYITLMNDGFLVELNVASCSECRKSQGMCGVNASTSMFMCICPDGAVHPISCGNLILLF
jgi:Wall-associated receptor kinase galacturonan-binding/Wall-associated receptor kinase C-terminal